MEIASTTPSTPTASTTTRPRRRGQGGDLVVVGTTGTLVHLEAAAGAHRYPIVIRQDDTGEVRWWIYYPPEEG